MNKALQRPQNDFRKGAAVVIEAKDEQFFNIVKPLIEGSSLHVEMSSGTLVSQNVYINLNLLELMIENEQQQLYEVINVHSILKTEIPT